ECDRKIGLMKRRRAAHAVAVKKWEALRIHFLCARLDAAVANPGRVADDDVESAARHHVREVDVEREESDLAVFDAIEQAAVRADALVQFAASLDVQCAKPAEKIALWCAEVFLLTLVEIDRLRHQLRCEALVVGADEARHGGTLAMRRVAIAG